MKHRQAVAILTLAVLFFTLAFSTLLQIKHRTFSYHDWRDEAVNNQLIYNTANGKPVYSTIKGSMRFHKHFRPIFFFCAAPFLVFDDIQAWFVTVSLAIGMGAFAIYAFVRRRLQSTLPALLLALVWLVWQPIHEITLGNYDPETLAATFWLFAALSFDSQKMRSFWIWTFMALICKETMATMLFGFGILALIQRRKAEWWAPAMIAGAAWFFIALKLIIPIYHPTFDTIYGRFAGCAAGSFPGCMISAFISHPSQFLSQIFSREHSILLFGLFRGVGFLSILGAEWLIPTLPIFAQILLQNAPLPVRQTHAISALLPFIFIAAIVGAIRMGSLVETLTKRKISTSLFALLVAAALLLINISLFNEQGLFGKDRNYGNNPNEALAPYNAFAGEYFDFRPEHAAAWQTIDLIPKNATAMTNSRFLVALSSRPVLHEFGIDQKIDDYKDDYILISLVEPSCRTCTYNYLKEKPLDQLVELVRTRRYRIVRAYEDHILLIRANVEGPPQSKHLLDRFLKVVEEAKRRAENGHPYLE